MENTGQLSIFRTESLGTGRFGTVFPGKFATVVEEVAIKRMKKEEIQIDSNLYAKANGQPNVIGYYDVDSSDVFIYIAIEYCMGTLADLVCGGNDDFAMTEQSHLPVLYQITTGLNQLHSLGIVHGNLKPSNILVSFPKGNGTEPMIKLADFGIRHAVWDEATGLTHFRLVTTEGWMCPADSQDPIESSFDTFPLGCLFVFVALNGFHPFGSDPASGIRNRQPIRLTLGQKAISLLKPSFLYLVSRMLKFDSKMRPLASNILFHPIFNQQSPVVTSSIQRNEPEQGETESYPLPSTTNSPIDVSLTPTQNSSLQIRGKQLKVSDAMESSDNSEDDYDTDNDVCISISPPPSPPQKNKGSSRLPKHHSYAQDSPPTSNSAKESNLNPTDASHVETETGEIIFDSHQPSVTSSSSSSLLDDRAQPSTSDGRGVSACGYEDDRRSTLSHHMNSQSGAKPFKCPDCPKTFPYPQNLSKHRKVHSPPEFKCEFCPKMFTSKSSRDGHMNSHTGAKPFKCTICKKGFSNNGNLSRHRNTHSAPKYKCPFCHKMFRRSSNCRAHWLGDNNGRIAWKVRRDQLSS